MNAPFNPAPPAAITRVLSRFGRNQLAGFIAVAIDLLDLADRDPDIEEDDAEDSFAPSLIALQLAGNGPGCTIGDPDLAVDDQGCDDLNDDREHDDVHCIDYGMDQTAPIGPTNPAVL
jgi:hypothetical protein